LNEHLYKGRYAKEKEMLDPAKALIAQQRKKVIEEEVEKLTEQRHVLRRQGLAFDDPATKAVREKIINLKHELELLDGSPSGISKQMREIDDFSAIVKKATIPEDMKVIRNVDGDVLDYFVKQTGSTEAKEALEKIRSQKYDMSKEEYFKAQAEVLNKSASGKRFIHESFMSTSFNADNNVFTGRPVQMQLYVDKGTTGLVTQNWYESEIVFDKDVEVELMEFKHEVIKDKRNNNEDRLVIIARVIKK
jgi:hypothetical protein